MKGILWYVTRKLEGIFDGILMEFRMRISEDKNQTQKSMYIPRFLSSGLYGSSFHIKIHSFIFYIYLQSSHLSMKSPPWSWWSVTIEGANRSVQDILMVMGKL